MDDDRNDDSSPEDDIAGLLRKQWKVIEGGLPVKAERDRREEWSVRVDKRRRSFLKLL
jgi:hypothetical protein